MSDTPKKTRRLVPAIICGSLAAAAFALLGGYLIHLGGEAASYGGTTFLVLPMATGLITGCFIRPLSAALLTTVISGLLSFVALLVTGIEGILCIALAAPLIVTGAFLGSLAGAAVSYIVRRKIGKQSYLLAVPGVGIVMILASSQLDNRLAQREHVEEVTTSRIVGVSRERVWQTILRADTMSSDEKPLLMRLGLPTPTSCSLTGEGVGAARTCHFESGVIKEEVTVWRPQTRLELRIVDTTLPGRHWLDFRKATYQLESVSPQKTRITRTTSFSSQLRPRWYWSNFERLGVDTEHQYVLDALFHDQ